MLTGDGGQHVTAQLALADPERRRGNVKHEVSTGSHQGIDRIDRVQPLVPELLVVPRVFADGKCHAIAAERKQFLTLGGSEVAHLIKNVVGGQQHLRLQEGDLPILQQRRGIHHGLAGFRFRGRH